MSPFVGIDEICDLRNDQKVHLCRFILVNEPYNLKLKLMEYDNLKCIQDDVTLINMYRCPFAIENANGDVTRETTYLISRGDHKTKAIIFRQNNLETDYNVDAVVYKWNKWMETKWVEDITNAGLLSREGRKYLSYHGESESEAKKALNRYLDFLHPERGKLAYS